MRYFLENKNWKAEFDTFGAELKSMLCKANYREYIYYGNPDVWKRTSPVLFPFVGGVKDKIYSYRGKTYWIDSHGFARDTEFDFLKQTENEIWFVLRDNETTRAHYPFSFEFRVGYILEENRIRAIWEIDNRTDGEMHFSVGAHPAFLCPVHGEENKKGYRFVFDTDKDIHHHGNWSKGLSVDEDLVLELDNSTCTLTEDFFDRSTYIIENKQIGMVRLEDPSGERIVQVDFDTPLIGIWSPAKKNAPFLCIEPWYGRCQDEHFTGDFDEMAYMNHLAKGESFEAHYDITFFELK